MPTSWKKSIYWRAKEEFWDYQPDKSFMMLMVLSKLVERNLDKIECDMAGHQWWNGVPKPTPFKWNGHFDFSHN